MPKGVFKRTEEHRLLSRESLKKARAIRSANKHGGYSAKHKWLSFTYGPASRCESNSCTSESNAYQYALKKGANHEYNRENYIQLCARCHKNYDITRNEILRLQNMNKGRVMTEDHKNKLSNALKEAWAKGKKIYKGQYDKKVEQFDLSGNYLRTFDSIMDAVRFNKIRSRSGITMCCKGHLKKSGGYGWRYAKL